MDPNAIAAAAFAIGTAGNLFKAVPQFVRTAVRGQVSGLSAGAVWLALSANLVWTAFGVAIGDLPFVALSTFGSLLTASTATRFVQRTEWRRNAVPATATLALAVVAIVLVAFSGDQVLAGIGVFLGLAMSVPQLVHLIRIRNTAEDVSGVSRLEYVVVIAAQCGWTTYWALAGQWLVAAGAAWGGLARVVTLALLLRQETRHASVPEPR